MKEVHYSTKARKDLKRYRGDLNKMKLLYDVLKILVEGESLPSAYRGHMLAGQYKGCMECHLANDYL